MLSFTKEALVESEEKNYELRIMNQNFEREITNFQKLNVQPIQTNKMRNL